MERLTNTEFGTTQELHAINPDGTEKWKHTFCNVYAEIGSLTPALAGDGTIYVSCNELTAFHPDGTVYWSNPNGSANGNYLAPAVASDGTIYGIFWTSGIGGGQTLRAWNPDGSVKWTANTLIGSFAVTSSPSIANDGTIYIGGPDPAGPPSDIGTLFALDSTGAINWIYAYGEDDILSSPAIDTDVTFYFGTIGDLGYIYAINSDGTFKWKHSSLDDAVPGANVDVYSSPIIGADGTIYIANEWGWIYAFNTDGTIKWKDEKIQIQGGTNWSSGALAADGTMYLGNTYGEFLAFRTDSHGMKATAQWPKFRYSIDNNGRRP